MTLNKEIEYRQDLQKEANNTGELNELEIYIVSLVGKQFQDENGETDFNKIPIMSLIMTGLSQGKIALKDILSYAKVSVSNNMLIDSITGNLENKGLDGDQIDHLLKDIGIEKSQHSIPASEAVNSFSEITQPTTQEGEGLTIIESLAINSALFIINFLLAEAPDKAKEDVFQDRESRSNEVTSFIKNLLESNFSEFSKTEELEKSKTEELEKSKTEELEKSKTDNFLDFVSSLNLSSNDISESIKNLTGLVDENISKNNVMSR